jgi:hypothetical protein
MGNNESMSLDTIRLGCHSQIWSQCDSSKHISFHRNVWSDTARRQWSHRIVWRTSFWWRCMHTLVDMTESVGLRSTKHYVRQRTTIYWALMHILAASVKHNVRVKLEFIALSYLSVRFRLRALTSSPFHFPLEWSSKQKFSVLELAFIRMEILKNVSYSLSPNED